MAAAPGWLLLGGRGAFLRASGREEGKFHGQGRAFPRELLAGGRVAHVEPDALEQLLDLQSRLVADLRERGREGAVLAVAVEGLGARCGRIGHDRAVRGVDDREPAAGGLVDRREWIVAAGVQDDDAGFARNRGQRIHEVGEPHGLQRHVGFPLDPRVDRNEEVLAVDLQAMAGIEHERDGVRALIRDRLGEIGDRPAHVALGEVGRLDDLEAGGIQEVRHRLGVIGRVRQRGDRGVARVADHQGDPGLGQRLADAHPAGRSQSSELNEISQGHGLSLHVARQSAATAKPLWPCRLVSWPRKPVQGRPPRRAKFVTPGVSGATGLPEQNDQRFGLGHRAGLEHHLEFAAVVAFDDQKIGLALIEHRPGRIAVESDQEFLRVTVP